MKEIFIVETWRREMTTFKKREEKMMMWRYSNESRVINLSFAPEYEINDDQCLRLQLKKPLLDLLDNH